MVEVLLRFLVQIAHHRPILCLVVSSNLRPLQMFPSLWQRVVKAVVKHCYRCELPGHGVKECKTVLLCEICAKDTHLTSKCAFPNQPKPTVQLAGSAPDGLRMFVAPIVKKATVDSRNAMAIINVHSGYITADQLVKAFNRMFQ